MKGIVSMMLSDFSKMFPQKNAVKRLRNRRVLEVIPSNCQGFELYSRAHVDISGTIVQVWETRKDDRWYVTFTIHLDGPSESVVKVRVYEPNVTFCKSLSSYLGRRVDRISLICSYIPNKQGEKNRVYIADWLTAEIEVNSKIYRSNLNTSDGHRTEYYEESPTRLTIDNIDDYRLQSSTEFKFSSLFTQYEKAV